MIRKLSLLLLPVITGIILWACTSPTDVAANRKITQETRASLNVEPGIIDLGEKQLKQPYTFELTLRNTSATQSVDIVSLRLKNATPEFVIGGPGLPLRLEPLQTVTIPLVFLASQPGVYIDTLLVNLDGVVFCPLRAVVPASNYAVWITDIDFGTCTVSQTNTMTGMIHNEGNSMAVIQSISISGPEANIFTFIFTPVTLPMVLDAGESVQFMVQAAPLTTGLAQATIHMDVNYKGTGEVDDTANLTVNVQ